MIVAGGLAMALALSAAGAPSQGPWILTCNMPPADQTSGASAQRIFRIGPRLFQQWRPADNAFGPNLCQSFSCIGAKDRLQGVISSPSVSLTVSLDLATGQGAWRTIGASGLKTTNGPCSVRADTTAAKPPAPAPQPPAAD
jgi:hypothetical protein